MKRLVFAAVICAAAGFCVHAEGLVPTQIAPWYDVGIRGYSAGDLPETIAEVGSWSKDEGVSATVVKPEEADAVIDLKAPTGKIAFTPATAPTTSAAAIETDVSFYAYEFEDMPSADNGSRTGFTAAQKQDGSYAFFGKSNGAWVEISNAAVAAAEHLSIKLRIELDTSATPAKARYLVNGNAMADANGATWLPVAETAAPVGAAPVEYAGVGQVASLTADTVDKTRAIAWCKRNGDGVVADIEYFATFADAKARIGEMGPADTMVAMQDLEIPLTPGETLSIDLTKFLNPENYTLTPTGVDGYKIVDGTEGTTYTLEVYPIKGFGTTEAPFEIGTADELLAFGTNPGLFGGAGLCFKLTDDITITSTDADKLPLFPKWNESTAKFRGTFDGDNHTVTYTLTDTDENHGRLGLFGVADGATIKNLIVNGTFGEGTTSSAAIVLGMGYGNLTFENVTARGSDLYCVSNVGGILCNWKADAAGDGIVFRACTNEAALVTGYTKAGGIFCYDENVADTKLAFIDCCNAGAITCTGSYMDKGVHAAAGAWAGGMAGWLGYFSSIVMTNCVNTGAISATQWVCQSGNSTIRAGGLVGNTGKMITAVNCSNAGSITGIGKEISGTPAEGGIGGLAGMVGTLKMENCSNSGVVAIGAESTEGVDGFTSVGSLVGNGAATVTGTITSTADIPPLGKGFSSALSFATVEGGVATFVTVLARDTQYKVMQAGGTATFELEAENDYISFDHALAGATYAITSKTGAVGTNDVDNVITFTALASVPTVVKPGEPIICNTVEEALNVKAKATFAPSDEVAKMFGENADAKAAYCAKFDFDVVPTSDGKWAVEAFLLPPDWTNVVKSAKAATLQIPVAELAAWQSGDDPIRVPLTNCVPGFYYSLYGGAAVTNLKADIRKENCNALCLCDAEKTAVLLEVTPPTACTTSGFFTVGVLETPSVIPGETETYTNIPHRKPTFPIPPGW